MPSTQTWYSYSADQNAHAIMAILKGEGPAAATAITHSGAVRYFGLLSILAGRTEDQQDSVAMLTRIVTLASGAAAQLGELTGLARTLPAYHQAARGGPTEPIWRATPPDAWPEHQPPWALVLGVGGVLSPAPLEGMVNGQEVAITLDPSNDFAAAGGWTALREAARQQPPDTLGIGWPLR